MATELTARRHSYVGVILAAAAIAAFSFLAFAQRADATPLFPAPSILNGPAEGSVLNTDSTNFAFDYLSPITGGSVSGFLCSIDGAPAVACSGSKDLVGLTTGTHTFGVKATITLLGGQPLCVLGVCISPGPLSVDTDLASRTFSVDVGSTSVGTGTNGANGSNGNSGTTSGTGETSNAFAIAMKRYLKQQAMCRKIKRSVHHYKSHKNRMSAQRRYVRCLKVQKKLRAAAMAAR